MFKNNRKVNLFISIMIFIIFIASNSALAKNTIILKYSDHDPPGGLRTEFLKNVWIPEIEKQTNGKVKIQDFWGGALMSSGEILKGINNKVTDIGFVYPGHYPGNLVTFTLFKLYPKGPKKFTNQLWLYKEVYKNIPEFTEELKNNNQKTILTLSGLPSAFAGKSPINEIVDIKGQKWRAGDKWALRFLKNVGAIPVSVPWDDVYMALQTGTIDGCFSCIDGMHMCKFDEVAKNIFVSETLWFAQPFIHNINLDTWNGLPEDVKSGILKACQIAEEKWARVSEEGLNKIIEKERSSGCTVKFMSKEDIAAWENAEKLEGAKKQWVKESKEAGLQNAEIILNKMDIIYDKAMAKEM